MSRLRLKKEKRSGKKRYLIFVLAFGVAVFLMTDTEKSPPPPLQNPAVNAPSQGSNVLQQPTHEEQSQPRITRPGIWPFFTEDQEEGKLAPNLTAKNYALIFDGSGSMNESECSAGRSKIDVAKESLGEWSKSVPEDVNLGMVAFHEGKWSRRALAAGQREDFIGIVRNVVAGGRTPLSKAFQYAYEDLTRQGRNQLGYGEYAIVVVTDGIANDEARLGQWVRNILENSPINIYTIGFCIGDKHSLNQPGKTVYRSADNPDELRQGLKEVLAESETFDDSDFN